MNIALLMQISAMRFQCSLRRNKFVSLTDFFLLVVLAVTLHSSAVAQEEGSSLTGQQLVADATAKTLYEITLLRLQREVPKYFAESDTAGLPAEIILLLKDAQQVAAEEDWEVADILLSEVLVFLSDREKNTAIPVGAEPTADSELTGESQEDNSSIRWHPEIFGGTELWQQEFELPVGLADTTLYESDGNPLGGIRLRFEAGLPNGNFTDGVAEGRWSRDYLSARMLLAHRTRLSESKHLRVQNELETTSYNEELGPGYLRDNLIVDFSWPLSRRATMTVDYNGAFQKYSEQQEFYINFSQHQLSGEIALSPKAFSRIALRYSIDSRLHPDFSSKDYQEHRATLRAFHGSVLGSSLYFDGSVRLRGYETAFADTLFNNDYLEGWAELEWRFQISRIVTTILRGHASFRDYQNPSTITPDYNEGVISPAFRFQLSGLGALELGYRLEQRHHLLSRLDTYDSLLASEDYISHGPTASFDLLGRGGFLLTVSDTFEFLRYPKSRTQNVEHFSLYSDRNVNSLLLYLSWPVSNHWEVDVFANYDNDLDVKENENNSRTTLFTIELRYLF